MDKDTPNNALIIGKLDKPIKANIVLRSSNSYEESRQFVANLFFVYGLCIKDAREANCELHWNEMTVKIDKSREINVKFPICVNTVKFEKGTVIKLLSADKAEAVQNKRRKTA